jgi:hypothetical protein
VRSKLERTVKSYKRKNKRVPELRIALGPILEGVTGNGSYSDLFGAVWALGLTRNGLKLARLGVAGWYEVTPLEPLPVLPSSARHIGLAFDQAARPVISWENGSEVFIRQWDGASNQYVVRGPFAGVDPVLVMDATVNGDIPNSDVILGHLNVFRDQFIYRVQRELYATPRVIPVAANSVLDAAFVSNYALHFFGSSNNLIWSVRSLIYPYIPTDSLSSITAIAPASGSYTPVVLIRDEGTDSLSSITAIAPVSGSYTPVVLIRDEGTDSLSSITAIAPNGGTYALA